MEESKAFLKGKAVGQRGKLKTNPYSFNTRHPVKCVPHAEWERGWLAGRDIFLNGKGYKDEGSNRSGCH